MRSDPKWNDLRCDQKSDQMRVDDRKKSGGHSRPNLLSDDLKNGCLQSGPQRSDDQRRACDQKIAVPKNIDLKTFDLKTFDPKTVDLKGFDRTSGDQKQADGPFHTRRQSDVLKSADPRGDGHWNVARCFRFQDVPPSCHPDRDGWVVIHHETDVDRVNLSRCQSQRGGGDRIVSS